MLLNEHYSDTLWYNFHANSETLLILGLTEAKPISFHIKENKMKKFLVLASIILSLSFVTTSLFFIAFNINLKIDALTVENIFNSASVGLLLEKYLPQETYYDGPQNNPSPLIELFKMLLLGVGFIFLSLIGRKMFKR